MGSVMCIRDSSYSLEFILETIGSDVTVKGDFIGNVEGFASLADAIEGDLSFFT